MDDGNSICRKRAREDTAEILRPKKQQQCRPINHDGDGDDDEKRYEFYEGNGVFDFPWLKEGGGVVFTSDSEPYFEDYEDKLFGPCSYDADDFHYQILQPEWWNEGDADADAVDDSLWSLLVDIDVDPADCIWSCVIDHPLDLGFNHKLAAPRES